MKLWRPTLLASSVILDRDVMEDVDSPREETTGASSSCAAAEGGAEYHATASMSTGIPESYLVGAADDRDRDGKQDTRSRVILVQRRNRGQKYQKKTLNRLLQP